MSELASKLEDPKRDRGGSARATFAQLDRRWGVFSEISDGYWRFDGMNPSKPEFWRKVSGSGASAMFERVDQ